MGDWQRFFSKSEVEETFFKWSERRKAELGMEGEEDVKVEYLVGPHPRPHRWNCSLV